MMRPDDLDRILSRHDEIDPSSGFLPAVMDAVMREASTPPPIPFPWMLGLLGLAASILTPVLLFIAAPSIPETSSELGAILEATSQYEAGWIALALVLCFASVKLSMRLAGARA